MPSPAPSKKGTNQFMRQGHTAGYMGNEPNVESKGQAKAVKELKP